MSVDTGVLVVRRSRAEIERLVALFGSSGMGRSEFCRSEGVALSTLARHLRKQQSRHGESRSKGVERSRLVPVELATSVASIGSVDHPDSAIILSINRRRIEVRRGFDRATLTQLVTVLERL
jgi:hypothetical protein